MVGVAYLHTYVIKSPERGREDKVINILDTGDSNGGNHPQEFAISKFYSAAQVRIKPLYEIFYLTIYYIQYYFASSYLHHLSTTVSLGATRPRAESTLDSSPTSMVPSLRAHNANALCP